MERLFMQRIFILTIGMVLLVGLGLLMISMNTVERIEANQAEIESTFEDIDARFERRHNTPSEDLSVHPSIRKDLT
jgi:hypothetical protein